MIDRQMFVRELESLSQSCIALARYTEKHRRIIPTTTARGLAPLHHKDSVVHTKKGLYSFRPREHKIIHIVVGHWTGGFGFVTTKPNTNSGSEIMENMATISTERDLLRTSQTFTSQIATVLDLCLYRVVTELGGGRVLPFGIRQMIKEYTWERFTNETISPMVQLWFYERAVALRFYGHINDWDVHRVTNMAFLFYQTTFNDRIDRWDVRNVTSMESMFAKATRFNQPLDAWDVRQATNMCSMFSGARAFNQPLASWNVSHVTDMQGMFQAAIQFNQPLDAWDVRQVTSMKDMFREALFFNQPLASWDVDQVTDMQGMFKDALRFNTPLDAWDVRQVTMMNEMFSRAVYFNQPLASWNVSHVTDMQGMFQNASQFNQPLDTWDVSQVTLMDEMFREAMWFGQPLVSWNVSRVMSMRNMFKGVWFFDQSSLSSWELSPARYQELMIVAFASIDRRVPWADVGLHR